MPLTCLALGGSCTIGEDVAPAGRWPAQLAERLRARGVPLDEPETLATTGWTTAELDGFSACADAQARRAGAAFIGVTGISRTHPAPVTDDGLHPDAAQYALWAAAIEPAAGGTGPPHPGAWSIVVLDAKNAAGADRFSATRRPMAVP